MERPSDAEVVSTVPLAAILEDYVTRYRSIRPSLRGRRGASLSDVEPVGPYELLSAMTGLPEGTLRKMRNPNRYPSTEYRVADALVAAVGCPQAFHSSFIATGQSFPPLDPQPADTAPRPVLKGSPQMAGAPAPPEGERTGTGALLEPTC